MIEHEQIRVVVALWHCLLRDALIERLKEEQWIEVCAIASDIADAGKQIRKYKPQVLVMNFALQASAGLSSIKRFKRHHAGLSVVALSCDSAFEDAYIRHVFRAGASSYVSVDDSLGDFIRAVREAGLGKSYLSERTKDKLQNVVTVENSLYCLSSRESEVFFLTGCGYAPQRIAVKMDLSVKTIESYRERIRKKLGLKTGSDLQYSATNFMRNAARRGISGSEDDLVKELLLATG